MNQTMRLLKPPGIHRIRNTHRIPPEAWRHSVRRPLPKGTSPIGARALLVLVLLLYGWGDTALAQVILNEFHAAPSDRLLRRRADAPPALGTGTPWHHPAFDDQAWPLGTGPFGFGYPEVATDLDNTMARLTPSLYLRGVFHVSAEQAASAQPVQLGVNYDDAFVAYLNGREIARANLGPAGLFIPARHPAFNRHPAGQPEVFQAGPASDVLRPGPNVLAIQAHGAWPAWDGDPWDTTLFLDAGVTLGTESPRELLGPASAWRHFVGRIEPSGGVHDPIVLKANPQDAGFHDWVELHNRSDLPVSLERWALTDDEADPAKWVFPEIILPGGGYLVVFCSGLDRRDPQSGPLHTNFKLEQAGEYLALRDAQGRIASEFRPGFPRQTALHSFGVEPVTGDLVYFVTPTPGGPNLGTPLQAQVQPVACAPPAGFHDDALILRLTSDTPGARIRFTLDGSEPTETHGQIYLDGIPIETNAIVRARAFRAGWIPSDTTTATFLLRQPDALRSLPAVAIGGDPGRTLYAPEGVTAISGGTYVGPDIDAIWTPAGPADYNMFLLSGPAVERPASLEWLRPLDATAHQWDCGLRVSVSLWSAPRMITSNLVGTTWNDDVLGFRGKPSFNLFFRGDYGPSQLDHPIFPGSEVTRFDSLRLRAGKNDWSNPFILDEVVRRLSWQMGQPTSRGILVNLFVNAQFKGYYNLVERLREDFFRSWYRSTAEWDVRVPNEVTDGDLAAWRADEGFLYEGGFADPARYQEATRRFDVVNLADYALLNLYCATADWPQNNWVLSRERSERGLWRFHAWDSEASFGLNTLKPVGYNSLASDLLATNGTGPLGFVFSSLHPSAEFRLLVADRVQKHLFGDGALTAGNVLSNYHRLKADLDPILEHVRRETVVSDFMADWVERRPAVILEHLRAASLWPSVPAPAITPRGGTVPWPAGLEILLETPTENGTLYYTLDGTDPRAPGGAPRGTVYRGPVTLSGPSKVQARLLLNGEWSPLAEAVFDAPPAPSLVLSEIHYDPPSRDGLDGRLFEFVEIRNAGTNLASLDGVSFVNGITLTLPAALTLEPGEHATVVADLDAFRRIHPDVPVIGVFSGRLDNAGERLTLAYRLTNLLFSVRYDNNEPWPAMAAGAGFSLVPSGAADVSPDDPRYWRASTVSGGSPGAEDPQALATDVVLNEVLARPAPGEDAWVELHNPTSRTVPVGGWYLSDDPLQPAKVRLQAGVTLPPGGFLVVRASEWNGSPEAPHLHLRPGGGILLLSATDDVGQISGASDTLAYEATPSGISFGRIAEDSGHDLRAPLRSATPGAANDGAWVGPVVISEILFDPAPGDYEFLEILNASSEPVTLADPANPLRTWQVAGAGFAFPPGTTLQPGERLVVTAADPQTFRARYDIPPDVRILGPMEGNLANEGERLRLERPESLAPGDVAYVACDQVHYQPSSPWPTATSGASLQRTPPFTLGDSPSGWRVARPTPGRPGIAEPTAAPELLLTTTALRGLALLGVPLELGATLLQATQRWDRVQFFASADKLAESESAPALISWHPSEPGSFLLRAVATLADGTDIASREVPIRILKAAPRDEVLVPSNSVWRYLAPQETPGAGWRLAGFPDSHWPAGPARLGDGSDGEATVLALAGTDTTPIPRVYLRHAFVVPDPAAWSHLVARLFCEPGGVVYLNGHEVHRRAPSGSPPAGRDPSESPGPVSEVEIPIDSAWLKAGDNLWAAEIQVDSTAGSRLTFGLELAGRRTLTEPWIVQQPAPQACREGAAARFEVRAAGEPVSYQWHRAAGGPVAGAQGPVLAIPSVSTADAGDYLVTVSNALGSVTSIVARLALLPPDTDGDGIPDAWETRFGLDPRNPRDAAGDIDGDGISNLEEYQLGSNPVRATGTQTVLISEIHYHPESGDPREEFIELFNAGLFPVNLQGWRFSDGVDFIFPSVSLPAAGRLVVAADPGVLRARHPAVTNVVGPWTGRLSNSGEALVLQDASRREVNRVRYADEGDWALRRRGAPDRGTRGWEWHAEHDGQGRSLELVQPYLSNNAGQNWTASLQPGGTPGAPNSAERDNVAPLIQQVAHQPVVPTPSQPIRVTALVTDEDILPIDVRLHYRAHSASPPPDFESVPMTDDGRGGDGLPGDGIFAGEIPAHAVGAILEYYVSARDNVGLERTWPAAVLDEHDTLVQEANANVQVVEPSPDALRPLFRLILTESERRTLETLDRLSNAEVNATWVTDDGVRTEVRHNAGLRIRGAATRSIPVPNLRLNFPSDRRWHDVEALNLNTYYWAHAQVIGSVLSLEAGIPAAHARAVELHLNGTNRSAFGAHVEVEVINADWAANLFPNDPDGNVYFARRPNTDLAHLGTDPARYRATGYSKESNQEEDDWTDLIRLTDVLNNTPDAAYADAVRQVLDPVEWVRYFALNSLLGNGETSLASGVGDDYDLYRGQADPRFLLVAHDWDSILSFANSQPVNVSIFQATAVPPVARFLKHPEFAPLYYAELQRLLNSVCSPTHIHATVDQWLGDFTPPAIIAEMKQYATLRAAAVQSQIPTRLTVQHPLPVTERPLRTTQPTVALWGQADAATTRAVRINGQTAVWTAWQARWSHEAVALRPGMNRLVVQSLDASGTVTEESLLDVWFDGGSETEVLAGPLGEDRTWTADHGPFFVQGSLTVPPGRTLTIRAGTTVFFAAGAELTVQGTLRVEGTPDARIRFAPRPGTTAPWGGIRIANSLEDNRLTHAILENPANRALWIDNSVAWLEGLEFITTAACLHFNNASLMVKDCRFPMLNQAEAIAGNGILPGGQMILRGNIFGGTTGYADLVDITAGKRPGPIVQAYDNLFTHGSDDGLDLDGTDAHIEGNVFLHIHQDAPRESQAAAIATDADADIVAVRNVFVDCDHAVLLKNGAFLTSHHNLYLGSTGAAVLFGSTNRTILPGRGAAMVGDIFWKNARTFDQHDVAGYSNVRLSVTDSLIPDPEWAGNGNQAADPLLINLTNDFRLRPGSPALGRGPHGLDAGPMVPQWAALSGEPPPVTAQANASLNVGGPGITHYRYQINDRGFDPRPIPVSTPLWLSNLPDGTYVVSVIGRNSAGAWQSIDAPTRSRPWTVQRQLRQLRINEVLARNGGAFPHHGTLPDAIELHNGGGSAADLSGMRLSDDPAQTDKFVFPSGTSLAAGEHLVLIAGDPDGTPGIHLGFSLRGEGEQVLLHDARANGGQLIDSVTFGLQIPGWSIGRTPDGTWTLCTPTFGQPNQPARLGDSAALRISEWLTVGAPDDFVELYNPLPVPVALSGLSITDKPLGWPFRHTFPALTFLAPQGYQVFIADDDTEAGADHLSFRLAYEQGALALVDAHGAVIDAIAYGLQRPGVSQGRRTPLETTVHFFASPSPGRANWTNAPPTVALTAPVDRQVMALPGPIALTASASDSDGRVALVEFYAGSTLLGTVSNPPFTLVWSNAPAAAHRFIARAIDDAGGTSDSAAVTIQPISPVCILTLPGNAPIALQGATLTLGAVVSNSPLAVSRISFQIGEALVLTDSEPPFEATWTPAEAGPIVIRATAVLQGEIAVPEAVAALEVLRSDRQPVTLVATNAAWKFSDSGAYPGAKWTLTEFDDQAWPAGPAPLGYGDGDEATVVAHGSTEGSRPVTVYFRHRFESPAGTTEFTKVVLRLMRDDGAVVFLNGTEITRSNMPEGPIEPTTSAAGAAADENALVELPLSAAPLIQGTNQLAVEIHQAAGDEEDLSFALELVADWIRIEPWILENPRSQTVPAGTPAQFGVRATGQPLSYQWHRVGAGPIPGATGADLVIPAAEPRDATGYFVVVHNALGSRTSGIAELQVDAPDADQDGIPDYWELRFGLDPRNPADAAIDLDGDGLANREEYRRDLSPIAWDTWIAIRPASPTAPSGTITLRWTLRANTPARLEHAADPTATTWEVFAEYPAEATPRVIEVPIEVPVDDAARFFRVTHPEAPDAPQDAVRLIWIPPGSFIMGSPPTEPDRHPAEGPQTQVTLSRGFWICRTEITQGEYLSLMSTNPAYLPGDLRRPAEWVSWHDAVEFCVRRTAAERAAGLLPDGYAYRLPTEAEWEYACRAGTTTRFSYGDDLTLAALDDYGWYIDNSGYDTPPPTTSWEYLGRHYTTHPVGSKRPNPWGLHDMHGSIKEWCSDWFQESLPGGAVTDPQGPDTGTTRSLRGGTWGYPASYLRSAYRESRYPDYRSKSIGFRPVLAPLPASP